VEDENTQHMENSVRQSLLVVAYCVKLCM